MHPRKSTTFLARARRRFSVIAVTVMATALVPAFAGTAHAASTTSFFLNTSPVAVGHTGYKMSMSVTSSFVSITLSRTASTGKHPTQSHSYSFFSFTQKFLTCNGSTMVCQVDTGTAMKNPNPGGRDYGKLKETYHPSSKNTVTNKCRNGTVIGSTTTAKGHLSGEWTLTTFNSFFGKLTNVGPGKIPDSIPATVFKFFSNGKSCPNPPPPPPPPCFQSLSLNASNSSAPGGSISFNASHSLPTGSTFESFGFSESGSNLTPASISHSISASGGPTSALTANATLGSGHADASWAGPFLTGGTTFTRTKAISTNSSKCQGGHHVVTKTAPGKVAGNLTAHFDGIGAKPLGAIVTDPVHGKNASITRSLKQ
jgi:hypothetical protein